MPTHEAMREGPDPADFWDLIQRVHSDPFELRQVLLSSTLDEVRAWFTQYLDACAELVDALGHRSECKDATEDSLDDLADSIVAMGRERYASAFDPSSQLPPREQWESLPTILHLFGEVYYQRTSQNIYDDVV